jgi:hypothetical protein
MGLSAIFFVVKEKGMMDEEEGVVSQDIRLKEYVEQWVRLFGYT